MKKIVLSLVTLTALTLTLAVAALAAPYIDSTAVDPSGSSTMAPYQAVGMIFTTGSGGPYTITDLKVNFQSYELGVDNYTVTAGLRTVDATNRPGTTDLVSTVLAIRNLSAYTPTLFEFTSLGAFGAYDLAPDKKYALMLHDASSENLGWMNGWGPVATSSGFTYIGSGYTGYWGDWWYERNQGNPNIAALGTASSVPEPSTYALFSLGLGGLALWKRRQQRRNG